MFALGNPAKGRQLWFGCCVIFFYQGPLNPLFWEGVWHNSKSKGGADNDMNPHSEVIPLDTSDFITLLKFLLSSIINIRSAWINSSAIIFKVKALWLMTLHWSCNNNFESIGLPLSPVIWYCNAILLTLLSTLWWIFKIYTIQNLSSFNL